MAFITLEDLLGNVEVIVFPRDYEKYATFLTEDSKIFIRGRVSVEEDKEGKVICESITPFDDMPKKVWIKFATKSEFDEKSEKLMEKLRYSEGNDQVILYIAETNAKKALPPNCNVKADHELASSLVELFGQDNVKIV